MEAGPRLLRSRYPLERLMPFGDLGNPHHPDESDKGKSQSSVLRRAPDALPDLAPFETKPLAQEDRLR